MSLYITRIAFNVQTIFAYHIQRKLKSEAWYVSLKTVAAFSIAIAPVAMRDTAGTKGATSVSISRDLMMSCLSGHSGHCTCEFNVCIVFRAFTGH